MTSISNSAIAINGAMESSSTKRLNQHIGAFIASLGGFALGVSIGWNSSTDETLRTTLKASATEISLIGRGLYVGGVLGALLLPFVHKCLSYTGVMFLTIPPFIIGWAFICLADENVKFLLIGRIICGICGSVHCILAPMHIAEVAEKNIRVRLLMFFHLLQNCGIMYAFVLAYIIEEEETIWRYSLMCAVVCGSISLVIFLPESPLYYLVKDDEHSAIRSLIWYRGKMVEIDEEVQLMKHLAKRMITPRSYKQLLKSRQFLRSLLVCLGVMITQQLSGINIIIFHALSIFNVGGSGDMSGSQQTIVVGTVQIVSCIVATMLVDIVGRRILLTVSLMMMGMILILLGWFYDVKEKDLEFEEHYFWMPAVWIVLLFAAFNIGVGPISWSLLGDSFPTEFKVMAASSVVAFNWMICFISDTFFGEIIDALGMSKTMFLFAACCWMGSAFTNIFVEDNEDKSLTEIHQNFGSNETPNSESQIVEEIL